jgi:hypothetical protein
MEVIGMSNEDNLKNTKGGYIHATVKGAISAIPVAGGFLSEIIWVSSHNTSRKTKRKHTDYVRYTLK